MGINNRILIQWAMLRDKTPGSTINYNVSFSRTPTTLITLHYGVATDTQRVSAWIYNTKNTSFKFGASFQANTWYFFYVAIGY